MADAGSASSAGSRARVGSSETSAVPADEVTETLPPAAETALAEDEVPTQRLPAGEQAEGDEAAEGTRRLTTSPRSRLCTSAGAGAGRAESAARRLPLDAPYG